MNSHRWLVVTTLGLSLACSKGKWSGDDVPEGAVAVTALRGPLDVTVPADGVLEATSASPIAVPRVPTGALKVKELAPEGSIVAPGDVVVVFDESQLSIELDNHRASFRSADRRIEGNELGGLIDAGPLEVMRAVAQLERDRASEFDITDAEIFSKLEIMDARVKTAEASETILYATASLRLKGEYHDIEERILDVERTQVGGKMSRVETSLGQLVLRAPIGGMLVYKKNWRGASASVGDTLWPGNVIMSIVDPGSVAVKAHVLERDAAGVAAGAVVEVRAEAAPDRAFAGKVKSVAEISAPIERASPVKYFEVVIELDAGDPSILKPGMKARARIRTAHADDAVIIPRAALRGTTEAPTVMVASESGTVSSRAVVLGAGDSVRVVVASGLEGGERVLLTSHETDAEGGDGGKPSASAAQAPGA